MAITTDTSLRRRPLYRRLPRGPSQLSRDDVSRNQRARLHGAMVKAVAHVGYRHTAVADVIGLAGVSRRAFYEHFRDKQHCLTATHENIVAHVTKQAATAWSSERRWTDRLHAASKAIRDDALGRPRGAHFVLVGAIGIGPGASSLADRTTMPFERLLRAQSSTWPNRNELPAVDACVVVGAIYRALFTCFVERRVEDLSGLPEELAEWAETYRVPRRERARASGAAPRRPSARPPKPPPTGSPGMPRTQRERVLWALADLTLARGYDRVTDRAVAGAAGVSTQSFHRMFGAKEACLLALVDWFGEEALVAVCAEMNAGVSWPADVQNAVCAFTLFLAENEGITRVVFGDLLDAGPSALLRLGVLMDRFTKVVLDAGPAAGAQTQLSRELISGALWATVRRHVSRYGVAQLGRLRAELSFLLLAPCIGAGAALEEINANRPFEIPSHDPAQAAPEWRSYAASRL